MRENFLLSYDKLLRPPYSEIPLPYFYVVEEDDRSVWYFGSNHSRDPHNIQYRQLARFWRRFVHRARKKASVLVEDGPYPPAKSISEAIRTNGENGYITFRAAELGIPVSCPEPTYEEQVAKLQKAFTKSEIAYFYFARSVAQWQRGLRQDSFEAYISRFLRHYQRSFNWPGFDFTLENMRTIHFKLFGQRFSLRSRKFFDEITFPSQDTAINRVSYELNRYRDSRVVNNITNEWKSGKHIFVVYGGSHAVVEEPAIKQLLGNGNKKSHPA